MKEDEKFTNIHIQAPGTWYRYLVYSYIFYMIPLEILRIRFVFPFFSLGRWATGEVDSGLWAITAKAKLRDLVVFGTSVWR